MGKPPENYCENKGKNFLRVRTGVVVTNWMGTESDWSLKGGRVKGVIVEAGRGRGEEGGQDWLISEVLAKEGDMTVVGYLTKYSCLMQGEEK